MGEVIILVRTLVQKHPFSLTGVGWVGLRVCFKFENQTRIAIDNSINPVSWLRFKTLLT